MNLLACCIYVQGKEESSIICRRDPKPVSTVASSIEKNSKPLHKVVSLPQFSFGLLCCVLLSELLTLHYVLPTKLKLSKFMVFLDS